MAKVAGAGGASPELAVGTSEKNLVAGLVDQAIKEALPQLDSQLDRDQMEQIMRELVFELQTELGRELTLEEAVMVGEAVRASVFGSELKYSKYGLVEQVKESLDAAETFNVHKNASDRWAGRMLSLLASEGAMGGVAGVGDEEEAFKRTAARFKFLVGLAEKFERGGGVAFERIAARHYQERQKGPKLDEAMFGGPLRGRFFELVSEEISRLDDERLVTVDDMRSLTDTSMTPLYSYRGRNRQWNYGEVVGSFYGNNPAAKADVSEITQESFQFLKNRGLEPRGEFTNTHQQPVNGKQIVWRLNGFGQWEVEHRLNEMSDLVSNTIAKVTTSLNQLTRDRLTTPDDLVVKREGSGKDRWEIAQGWVEAKCYTDWELEAYVSWLEGASENESARFFTADELNQARAEHGLSQITYPTVNNAGEQMSGLGLGIPVEKLERYFAMASNNRPSRLNIVRIPQTTDPELPRRLQVQLSRRDPNIFVQVIPMFTAEEIEVMAVKNLRGIDFEAQLANVFGDISDRFDEASSTDQGQITRRMWQNLQARAFALGITDLEKFANAVEAQNITSYLVPPDEMAEIYLPDMIERRLRSALRPVNQRDRGSEEYRQFMALESQGGQEGGVAVDYRTAMRILKRDYRKYQEYTAVKSDKIVD